MNVTQYVKAALGLALMLTGSGVLPINAQPAAETNFVIGGLPRLSGASVTEDILVLTNRGYIVGYSETKRNPRWVCYRLSKVGAVDKKAQNPERKNNFRADLRTKPPQVGSDAFEKLPYDRGHMAPSYGIGSRYGETAQDETFLMSNMCPQQPKLNRGIWKRLETKEADYLANGLGEVWIMAGPIFKANSKKIGKYQVEEPVAYFKIIVDNRSGKPRVLPFRMELPTIPTQNLDAFLTSVDSIEKQTGIDFFGDLPASQQKELEKQKPSAIWKVSK